MSNSAATGATWICGFARKSACESCSKNSTHPVNHSFGLTPAFTQDHAKAFVSASFPFARLDMARPASCRIVHTVSATRFTPGLLGTSARSCHARPASATTLRQLASDSSRDRFCAARTAGNNAPHSSRNTSRLRAPGSFMSACTTKSRTDGPLLSGSSESTMLCNSSSFKSDSGNCTPCAPDLAVDLFRTFPTARQVNKNFWSNIDF
mmetsp:Transcript_66086/g.175144  ORF Transcript_66086/g.175144 Transcript_66086/m.175144 type:complete len:208 (+) Transcript_66086:575-1198(+)